MYVVRRHVELVIAGPSGTLPPTDGELEAVLAEQLDCISAQEFDTVDEHPAWDFIAARVCNTANGQGVGR